MNDPRIISENPNAEAKRRAAVNARVMYANNRIYSNEQRNELRSRMNTRSMNPQDAANARIALENSMRGGGNSLSYRGNASKRTLSYRNRGSNKGLGAAVNNRAERLREMYGNDPRIARAAGNILANAYT